MPVLNSHSFALNHSRRSRILNPYRRLPRIDPPPRDTPVTAVTLPERVPAARPSIWGTSRDGADVASRSWLGGRTT